MRPSSFFVYYPPPCSASRRQTHALFLLLRLLLPLPLFKPLKVMHPDTPLRVSHDAGLALQVRETR